MRVVQDASTAKTERDAKSAASGTGVATQGGSNVVSGAAEAAWSEFDAASARKKGLPMLQAGIFLLACVIGGIAFVIVRPL